MTKNEQRAMMKKRRQEFPTVLREKKSDIIAEFVFDLKEFQSASCVCAYMSAFGEVITWRIIEECLKQGKSVAVPITDKETNTLTLSYIGDSFKTGAYGIAEPSVYRNCAFDEPDLILVPGICFDKTGGRIGFGKGYYDRFLAEARGFKVGLCFAFQMVDEIDFEPHDVRLDAVICENGCFEKKID